MFFQSASPAARFFFNRDFLILSSTIFFQLLFSNLLTFYGKDFFVPFCTLLHRIVFVKLVHCNTELFEGKSKLYLMCIYKIFFINNKLFSVDYRFILCSFNLPSVFFPKLLKARFKRRGLTVSALACGLGSSPGRGHCVVFLGKTLQSRSASLHPGV